MRSIALLGLLTGCARAPEHTEPLGTNAQRFTSEEAVLLDFAFDGTLVADTADPGRLKTLIFAQLMYSVGQLNGDRAVGRHERLELSAITASPMGSERYAVKYHARLPVAWGGVALPASYAFTLPARVGEEDQIAFAAKYGVSCADASAGPGEMEPGRMFLFYRPHQPDCTLAAEDVATFSATVAPSVETSTGKYPEYHRIWDDERLDVVAIFSRAKYTTEPDDEGVFAYEEFLARVSAYWNDLRPATVGGASGVHGATFEATLTDGRTIAIHTRLVGAELDADASFDAWYDALTPTADVIFYSGHAGLGANIRALMSKGSFVAKKYVIWAANGCDTFAYVDRTLADRRASLNPDDPSGTKYMDVVSNVMAGYFVTTPATSMAFVEAIVEGGDPTKVPKTYRQIFKHVDPTQVMVVTGEEDNEFQPSAPPSKSPPTTKPNDDETPRRRAPDDPAGIDEHRASSACSTGSSSGEAGSLVLTTLVGLSLAVKRRRRRARSAYVGH